MREIISYLLYPEAESFPEIRKDKSAWIGPIIGSVCAVVLIAHNLGWL